MRVALAAALGQEVAQSVTCIAGDFQEAERYALAVVRHAHGRSQHALQGGRIRSGLAQLPRGHRAAGIQGKQGSGVGHGV